MDQYYTEHLFKYLRFCDRFRPNDVSYAMLIWGGGKRLIKLRVDRLFATASFIYITE